MAPKDKKLYFFILLACVAGYVWLFIKYHQGTVSHNETESICIIKHTTGVPCPSCGSTRSVVSLLDGDVLGSIYWNPIGLLLFLIMTILPVWIIIDFLIHKQSFLYYYRRFEQEMKKPMIYIPFALVMVINWIWNLMKGL